MSIYSLSLVVILAAVLALKSVSVSQLSAFFPSDAIRHSVSQAIVGIILAAGQAGELVGIALTSTAMTFVARISIWRAFCGNASIALLIGSLLSTSVSNFMMAAAGALHAVGIYVVVCASSRALLGISGGVLDVVAYKLALSCTPEHRLQLIVGLLEGCRAIGSMLGPLMGGSLSIISASIPFLVSGLAVGVAAVMIWLLTFCVPQLQPQDDEKTERAFAWHLLVIPSVTSLLVAHASAFTVLGFFEPTLEPYLRGPLIGWSGAAIGGVQASVGVVYICSTLLIGVFVPLVRPEWLRLTQIGVLIMGVVVMGLATLASSSLVPLNITLSIVAYVSAGAGFACVNVTTVPLLMGTVGAHPKYKDLQSQEAIATLVVGSSSIGSFVGTTGGAAIVEAITFRPACTVATCMLAGAALSLGVVLCHSTGVDDQGITSNQFGGESTDAVIKSHNQAPASKRGHTTEDALIAQRLPAYGTRPLEC
jgi:MFS family permease